MKKRMMILIISSLVLTGCWDKRELDELAITMAIGVDESDVGYLVTAQVVVPLEVSIKGNTGNSPITQFRAEGETIFEAIRKLAKIVPREIYPGHLRMLVISDTVAEKGIGEIVDYFSRNWEMRSDFYVVVAKEMTAQEILNVSTAIETIPANSMFNMLNVAQETWSSTRGIHINDLISDIGSGGKEAVVTGIEVIGDEELGSSKKNVETITPGARLRLLDLGVFKEDKLVGWLTEEESIGYNKVTNQVKSSVTTLSCPEGGTIAIELIRAHSKIKAKIINGTPEVEVKIKTEGNIAEVDCQLDLMKVENITMLEKLYSEKVKEKMQKSITTLQKDFNADIFGFGEAVHRADAKVWKKLEPNWDQEFSELQVNIKVDAKITQFGVIVNPVKIKEKE
ncbi:Ger(x)C family spore germination protein [Paenisporosarcina macmurdoensis]|uniref:Ger(X)C family spore germination protein n=1 Tax=Paenisporosarcina macmurdoensis TaxID=212659 RepID=A0ABW1LA63_9BACL